MTLFAQFVDGKALLYVVAASVAAGGGLTIAFSTMVLAVTRASDLRRAGSRLAATVLTVLAALAMLVCIGLVVFGLRVMVED